MKAQHAEAAGLIERALDYWEQAGTQALARPAYKEAIASLENAVRLCRATGRGPAMEETRAGPAAAARTGIDREPGLSGAGDAARLRACAGAGRRDRRRVLATAGGVRAMGRPLYRRHGFGRARRALCRACRDASRERAAPRRAAHARSGALPRGPLQRVARAVDEGLRHLRSGGASRSRHRFGHDPRAAAANYEAWNLWHLGFPDQAARTSEDNLRWAREVNHANTTGIALCYGANVAYIWLRRPDRVESGAREALRLAEDKSMALWHALG